MLMMVMLMPVMMVVMTVTVMVTVLVTMMVVVVAAAAALVVSGGGAGKVASCGGCYIGCIVIHIDQLASKPRIPSQEPGSQQNQPNMGSK